MPTDLPKKPKQPPLGKSLLHIATMSLHTPGFGLASKATDWPI
jgi:hypothetical protein